MKLGICRSAEQRYDEASRHFEQALRMSPPEEAWLIHDEYGLSLLEQKKYEPAMAHFRAALDAVPDHPIVTRHLVGAVLGVLRDAVQRAPNDVNARIELGTNLLKAGDAAGAVLELSKAVDLRPADAATHNYLGAALAQAGDLPGAIQEFEQALKHDPKHAGAAKNLKQAGELLAKPPAESKPKTGAKPGEKQAN